MDKYVERALKSLGYKVLPDEKHGVKDFEYAIKESEENLITYKDQIEELKDAICKTEQIVSDFKAILHQVKVEEYKELNKDRDVEIF